MKKGKAGIFTLSSTSLMVCECLISIIVIFLDTFLVSKILKLTPGNYSGVAIFNFLYYMMIALAALSLTPILMRINKSVFLSVGALSLAGMFIVVYLLGDRIIDWIWLLGIGTGLTYGIFSAGFNSLLSQIISSKNQTVYFSVKNILIFLTKTVFPLVLGSIVNESFPLMCIILAAVCVAIFVFSFMIKSNKQVVETYNLFSFWKTVKNGGEETKPLRTLYLSGFFRGLCFDCIATVLTVLVFLNANGNDFTIGLVQTIFTGSQLVSMFIFMKSYHKNLAQWFIFVSLGIIIAASIPVFVKPCLITVLIFYGIYYFFRLFITTITDMRKPTVIRLLSMHSHSLEHNTTYALVAGVTRACTYLLFMLWTVVPELTMVYIILGVNLVGYTGYSITLFKLERELIIQDINWKKAHPDPNIPDAGLPNSIEKIAEKA